MQKFQDTFETRKRSFIDAFFNCMTVNLNMKDCRAISIKTLYKVGKIEMRINRDENF